MRVPTGLFLLGLSVAVSAQTKVPVRQGLTVVTALSDRLGDYESIKTVESVSADAIRLSYSARRAGARARGSRRDIAESQREANRAPRGSESRA